jgi:hypothetical protein
MSRADFREEAARGFDVVVIARNSREVQTVELLARQETVGSTEINLALIGHAAVSGERLFEFFAGERAAGGNNREAIHALALIGLSGCDNHILREEGIFLTARLRVCGLRAVLAVLAAAAASAVNNGAEIHLVLTIGFAELIRSLTELFEIRAQKLR